MDAPVVESVIVTVTGNVYVPAIGVITGAAAVGLNPLVNVQLSIFWLDEDPPVPAVNPTYAVFPPTRLGMFTGQLVENVFPATPSVIVNPSVVPSYVSVTVIVSPLCRLIPEAVRSIAGTVGEAPFSYMPVVFAPSPALLKRSNFNATLFPIGVFGLASGLVGLSGP